MNITEEDQLILDLITISRKKEQIKETLAFTRKAHEAYLGQQRRARIRLVTFSVSGVAAVLLLALMILPSFLALDGTSAFNSLYQRFDPGMVARGSDSRDQMTTLISLYDTGKFNETVVLSDSILNIEPDNNKVLFFKGLAEIELHHTDQAIRTFSRTIPQGGPVEAYSRWYLALIYLQQGNFTACREQLSALKKTGDHPYKSQVNKLYRQLRFRKNQ